ncbi:MAG: LPD1 domain-containing protein [Bacteroidota bacterium]|nr:LPD1 domain-containing protein [Bacteroidota bacterium]
MKAEVNKIINDFLNLTGDKTPKNFKEDLKVVAKAMRQNYNDEEAIIKLDFVRQKLENGLEHASKWGEITVVIMDTEHDIDSYYKKHKGNTDLGKMRPRKSLGKLVDEGEVPTSKSRADNYWEGKTKVIFTPNNKQIRSGSDIPKSYDYDNIEFLERHYNLKSIEFGNWLSQQDRKNYLAGLGLALYDLTNILGFAPSKLSLKKKITVAFGARGRGSALAHFESDTFAINITRYSRPRKGSTLKPSFDRTKLLTLSGGVGSFAHEYGHALDYFGGMFAERGSTDALSDGRSLRIRTDKKQLQKNTLRGLMERLLNKIIWSGDNKHSAYFLRLKSKQKSLRLTDYYFRRNELFARAFESYVHYKMQKKRYKNIFLAETKYDPKIYLTPQEIKKLEPDFDALISALKKVI